MWPLLQPAGGHCLAVGWGLVGVGLGARLEVQLGDRPAAFSGHCLKAGLHPQLLHPPLCTSELENGVKFPGALAAPWQAQPPPWGARGLKVLTTLCDEVGSLRREACNHQFPQDARGLDVVLGVKREVASRCLASGWWPFGVSGRYYPFKQYD